MEVVVRWEEKERIAVGVVRILEWRGAGADDSAMSVSCLANLEASRLSHKQPRDCMRSQQAQASRIHLHNYK